MMTDRELDAKARVYMSEPSPAQQAQAQVRKFLHMNSKTGAPAFEEYTAIGAPLPAVGCEVGE